MPTPWEDRSVTGEVANAEIGSIVIAKADAATIASLRISITIIEKAPTQLSRSFHRVNQYECYSTQRCCEGSTS
jgi:hypothetical protein